MGDLTLEQLGTRLDAWLYAAAHPLAQWLAEETVFLRREQVLCYLVGGTLRDLALGKNPRDLDIIIDPVSWDLMQARWHHLTLRRNIFGGLKLKLPQGGYVDVWGLHLTHGFDSHLPKSANQYPATVCFNLEAVIMELPSNPQRMVWEAGFCHGMRTKTLDFIPRPHIINRELTAARACMFLLNHPGFRMASRLRTWVLDTVAQQGIPAIYQASCRHYHELSPQDVLDRLQLAVGQLLTE